ncbi:MAG: VTT domain-containing protein [Chloroflexota bacterium]
MQQQSTNSTWKSWLLPGCAVAVVFIVFRYVDVEDLQALVARAGVFGPLVYILLRVVGTTIIPLVGGTMHSGAGIVFGFIPGVLYSVMGAAIGHSLNFWLARRFGRAFVTRLLGERTARIDPYIERLGSVRWLVFSRVFLISAYDFIAYAAGLSRMRFVTFVLVTTLFSLPSIIIAVGGGLLVANGFDISQLSLF